MSQHPKFKRVGGRPPQDSSLEALFKEGLLKICESLHMHIHGSSDPLSESEYHLRKHYLRTRLDSWKPSNLPYDEAVRGLVLTTLGECFDYESEDSPEPVWGWST